LASVVGETGRPLGRVNPSRDALILIGAFGLELAVHELDEVLMAADYKPLVLPASIR
jgi:hypothetical protein